MLLQWTEQDEMGREIVKTNPNLRLNDVHTYAKRNCRRCAGRGIEKIDHNNKNPISKITFKVLQTCDCVLRTLLRIENVGK